jgi:hypothetical protein
MPKIRFRGRTALRPNQARARGYPGRQVNPPRTLCILSQTLPYFYFSMQTASGHSFAGTMFKAMDDRASPNRPQVQGKLEKNPGLIQG